MIIRVCLIAFITLCSEFSMACDCLIMESNEGYSKSKFVAYGVVKEVKVDTSNKLYEGLVGDFQALVVFKGSASSIKSIRGGARNSAASCILKLVPGEYVVYTNEETAYIGICNYSENITGLSLEKKNSLLKSLRNLSMANGKL
jgi:hypothetical protein